MISSIVWRVSLLLQNDIGSSQVGLGHQIESFILSVLPLISVLVIEVS